MDEIAFQEGDTKSFENLIKAAMEKPIRHFEKELISIRTGRASTSLVENVKVDCYGQSMPLKELATMAAPDARMITIQPWDKSTIEAIEKALQISDLGVTPINDGTLIRIQLPQMSTARREELVKVLGKKTEECRVGVRNVRKEFHNEARDAVKKKIVSEDFGKKLNEALQKITDEFIAKAESLHDKKASDITSV